MTKRKRKVKFISVMVGIIVFVIGTFFTYILMDGIMSFFNISSSNWTKIVIGFAGLLVAGLIGWWGYK